MRAASNLLLITIHIFVDIPENMLSSNCVDDLAVDLAGRLYPQPHCLQTRSRINFSIDRYLSFSNLSDRLADLPTQFANPQPRPWQAIYWHDINPSQIVGLRVEVFLAVLLGAMTVESPIRGYSQVSGQYLSRFHAPMARFVGGDFAEDGSLIDLGLWEKEERRHSPALAKIYKQLTGETLIVESVEVKPYQPSQNPHADMYRHGLHRVATEYGATCLYLWLMAHSTGALQRVLEEILLDEINHMTKFLGFGIWAFHSSDRTDFKSSLWGIAGRHWERRSPLNPQINGNHYWRSALDLVRTFVRVMDLVNWKVWHPISKLELTYTFMSVLRQILRWHSDLTPAYLQELFGNPPSICDRETPSIPIVGMQR
jgi:hypothetical protein